MTRLHARIAAAFASFAFMAMPLRANLPPRLPSWALEALGASRSETEPQADAWVILDRTEYSYRGSGLIRVHRYRLSKVITWRGVSERVFSVSGIGGRASKVRKLLGWNFRPSGPPTTVERQDALLVDPDAGNEVTADLETFVSLPDVEPGSLVAFESEEDIAPSMGPFGVDVPVGRFPTLKWELSADRAWLTSSAALPEIVTRNLDLWSHEVISDGRSLTIRHLPAYQRPRGLLPPERDFLPLVFLRFLDPSPSCRLATAKDWRSFGQMYGVDFLIALDAVQVPGVVDQDAQAFLKSLKAWMDGHLIYRQVYLSDARGWIPAPASHALRSLSGDCKDMSAFLLAAARSAHLDGVAALARIDTGKIKADEPLSLYDFNHVIAAVKLPRPMGLPAEVTAGGDDYLLMDPTDSTTPFGYLNQAFDGNRVLLCSPDPAKGGMWVDIPSRAIMPASLDVRFEGALLPTGTLEGMLDIVERGGMKGFAQIYREKGEKAFCRECFPLISDDPACRLHLVAVDQNVSDLRDFHVQVSVDVPDMLKSSLGTALPALLLPRPMLYVGSACQDAALPVFWEAYGSVQWTARIQLPAGWSLKAGRQSLDAMLHKMDWSVSTATPGVAEIKASLVEHRRGWNDAQEGLRAVHEDAEVYRAFLKSCFHLSTASNH